MARFKLSTAERELPDEPFEVEGAEGHIYPLPHPKSLQYETLVQFDIYNPIGAMKLLIGEQYDAWAAEPDLDGFALEEMFNAYLKHYGLPSPGEAPASPA